MREELERTLEEKNQADVLHMNELSAREETHKRTLRETENRFTKQISDAKARFLADLSALNAQRKEEGEEASRVRTSLEETLAECNEELLILRARLHAWQKKSGEDSDEDLTEKQAFLRLEAERAWFESFFRDTWKQTKKRIRRELIFGVGKSDKNVTESGSVTENGTQMPDGTDAQPNQESGTES